MGALIAQKETAGEVVGGGNPWVYGVASGKGGTMEVRWVASIGELVKEFHT